MDNHVYGYMKQRPVRLCRVEIEFERNSMSDTVAINSNGDSDNKLVNPSTDQSAISLQ